MIGRNNIFIFFIAVIFLSLCFAGCIEDNHKENVYILGTEKGYATLSAALADAVEGDTIVIQPGIYYEHVSISKSLTIQGKSRDEVIFDGNGEDDVFFVTADNVTIAHLTVRNAGNTSMTNNEDAGIDLRSEQNTIIDVNCSDNINYGLFLYQAHNNSIRDCLFRDNGKGGLFALYCNHNQYLNNTVVNNSEGLYLRYIYDSMVANNSVSHHDQTTIDKGIYLYASRRNIIRDNAFTQNEKGLHVKGSKDNDIRNNLFLGNIEGLYFCCGGMDNIVYQNVFMNNQRHAEGNQVNQFDNGTIGNYWDDYTGEDTNGDGIGEQEYIVTESYSFTNVDRFPLVHMN